MSDQRRKVKKTVARNPIIRTCMSSLPDLPHPTTQSRIPRVLASGISAFIAGDSACCMLSARKENRRRGWNREPASSASGTGQAKSWSSSSVHTVMEVKDVIAGKSERVWRRSGDDEASKRGVIIPQLQDPDEGKDWMGRGFDEIHQGPEVSEKRWYLLRYDQLLHTRPQDVMAFLQLSASFQHKKNGYTPPWPEVVRRLTDSLSRGARGLEQTQICEKNSGGKWGFRSAGSLSLFEAATGRIVLNPRKNTKGRLPVNAHHRVRNSSIFVFAVKRFKLGYPSHLHDTESTFNFAAKI
ncbi:hypothetical protein DFH09DRAFT_1067558 [Mycena vulgaris]|nr:hypothetical protein DFH09DRAFT_1067558 [Mycena vulgaris]